MLLAILTVSINETCVTGSEVVNMKNSKNTESENFIFEITKIIEINKNYYLLYDRTKSIF